MADSMTEEQALRKALDRERARRRKAEMLLEEKSRELFDSFSELEKTYATLKANQKQLVKSEKMASLGILSAGVAHEINNPAGFVLSNLRSLHENMPILVDAIGTCRGFLTNAGLDPGLAPSLATESAKIKKNMESAGIDYILEDIPDLLSESTEGLERIRDIVSGLRSFSKTDDVTRERVDLNRLVHSSLAMVRGNFPENLEVTESYTELPALCVSKAGLSQVILNLLSNAGDAIAEAGDVAGRIDIETKLSTADVRVIVSDSGCGISPENIEKLFTPFYTTKDVGKGTGLGLSASIGVVEEHGGRIEVTSERGGGACFNIVLPLSVVD